MVEEPAPVDLARAKAAIFGADRERPACGPPEAFLVGCEGSRVLDSACLCWKTAATSMVAPADVLDVMRIAE